MLSICRNSLNENAARPKKKKKKKKKHKTTTATITDLTSSLLSPEICRLKDVGDRPIYGPNQDKSNQSAVKRTFCRSSETVQDQWSSLSLADLKLSPSGSSRVRTNEIDANALRMTQDVTKASVGPPLSLVPRSLNLDFFGHHSHSTQLLLPKVTQGELYAWESMTQVYHLGGVIWDARQVVNILNLLTLVLFPPLQRKSDI